MIRNGVICAALLTAVTGAQASQWTDFDAGHVSVIAYDKSSMTNTGKLVKVWTREAFTLPQPATSGSGALIDQTFTRYIMDCKARSMAIGEIVSNYHGATVERAAGEPQNFLDVIPDSFGEHLLEIACRK